MTPENINKQLLEHSLNIQHMNEAIGKLVETVSDTNEKLDSLVEVITKQELLAERLVNIDTNTRDAFNRAFNKMEELEETQKLGCTPLVVLTNRVDRIENIYNNTIKAILGAIAVAVVGTVLTYYGVGK